jgi:hypothetical protein
VDADPAHGEFGTDATERRLAQLTDEVVHVTEALHPAR